MHTILIVDDDADIRELLSTYLASRGMSVRSAEDGEDGLMQLRGGGIDLVVLDVMMPGIDGFEVCRRIRAFSQVPVVLLTARGDEVDRVVGLELGADDYLAKPFSPRELLARMQAIFRRMESAASPATAVHVGPLTVDIDRREVTMEGTRIELTTTEFELLRVLAANAGRVIPRERLMEMARGDQWASFDRSVDVHVSHIRAKLGDDGRRLIVTVRGIGYTMPRL